MSAGPPATAPGERRILIAPLRPGLAAGAYKVEWRVVSLDSHVTQGDFDFTIRP